MNGPDQLREMINRVLEALRLEIGREADGGSVGLSAVDAAFDRFMSSPDYLPFYQSAYHALNPGQTVENRRNVFGRLMVEPLIGLIDDGIIDRDLLPNLFSFFRLALGDEQDQFDAQCQTQLDLIKAEAGDRFTWDMFYQDPRMKHIYWHVLKRIAVLFKRWDARQDWFLKLMQYTPAATSLGSTAFHLNVPSGHDPKPFDVAAFQLLFQAFFAPFARLTPSELTTFRQTYGDEVVHNCNAVLRRLSVMGGAKPPAN